MSNLLINYRCHQVWKRIILVRRYTQVLEGNGPQSDSYLHKLDHIIFLYSSLQRRPMSKAYEQGLLSHHSRLGHTSWEAWPFTTSGTCPLTSLPVDMAVPDTTMALPAWWGREPMRRWHVKGSWSRHALLVVHGVRKEASRRWGREPMIRLHVNGSQSRHALLGAHGARAWMHPEASPFYHQWRRTFMPFSCPVLSCISTVEPWMHWERQACIAYSPYPLKWLTGFAFHYLEYCSQQENCSQLSFLMHNVLFQICRHGTLPINVLIEGSHFKLCICSRL